MGEKFVRVADMHRLITEYYYSLRTTKERLRAELARQIDMLPGVVIDDKREHAEHVGNTREHQN